MATHPLWVNFKTFSADNVAIPASDMLHCRGRVRYMETRDIRVWYLLFIWLSCYMINICSYVRIVNFIMDEVYRFLLQEDAPWQGDEATVIFAHDWPSQSPLLWKYLPVTGDMRGCTWFTYTDMQPVRLGLPCIQIDMMTGSGGRKCSFCSRLLSGKSTFKLIF